MRKRKSRQIFEVFGVVGLILSLIYVGYELRQNTIATRSQAHQALSEIFIAGTNVAMSDPVLASIILRASLESGEMTEAERNQYVFFVASEMHGWELAFYSHRDGALLDEVWESWDSGYCAEARHPAFREAWSSFIGGVGWGKSFYEHAKSCFASE